MPLQAKEKVECECSHVKARCSGASLHLEQNIPLSETHRRPEFAFPVMIHVPTSGSAQSGCKGNGGGHASWRTSFSLSHGFPHLQPPLHLTSSWQMFGSQSLLTEVLLSPGCHTWPEWSLGPTRLKEETNSPGLPTPHPTIPVTSLVPVWPALCLYISSPHPLQSHIWALISTKPKFLDQKWKCWRHFPPLLSHCGSSRHEHSGQSS